MKSVNDLDLRVGSQAFELLRKLIDATHLTVVIERGGKPLTYVYLLM